MSNKVRYSINGQYFSDYGVSVAYSKGIADALKRKKVNSYDWAEYHGISVDLSKPKYEPREIELQCFIIGDNWQVLFANFNKLIRDEFARPGTQRLLIEPFGYKALPYEVFMMDEIQVEKRFKEGKMAAVFTLRMIEPNPVKKVLYFAGDKLDLSYNCPTETEIFYGNGTKDVANGSSGSSVSPVPPFPASVPSVSITGKALAPRTVSRYPFDGRNYFEGGRYPTSWAANDVGTLKNILTGTVNGREGIILFADSGKAVSVYSGDYIKHLVPGETYTIALWAGQHYEPGEKTITIQAGGLYAVESIPYYNFKKIVRTFVFNGQNFLFGISSNANTLDISEIKIDKGSKATDYSVAPEAERHIIIAGNVEEITNLTTNAEVLWERL